MDSKTLERQPKAECEVVRCLAGKIAVRDLAEQLPVGDLGRIAIVPSVELITAKKTNHGDKDDSEDSKSGDLGHTATAGLEWSVGDEWIDADRDRDGTKENEQPVADDRDASGARCVVPADEGRGADKHETDDDDGSIRKSSPAFARRARTDLADILGCR